eukprot:1275847-Pyramimonas_sp.AAC.1
MAGAVRSPGVHGPLFFLYTSPAPFLFCAHVSGQVADLLLDIPSAGVCHGSMVGGLSFDMACAQTSEDIASTRV